MCGRNPKIIDSLTVYVERGGGQKVRLHIYRLKMPAWTLQHIMVSQPRLCDQPMETASGRIQEERHEMSISEQEAEQAYPTQYWENHPNIKKVFLLVRHT